MRKNNSEKATFIGFSDTKNHEPVYFDPTMLLEGKDMAQERSVRLELSMEEVLLIEELLRDYGNNLRHEARLDLDLAGDKESAQRHMEQAGEMDRLREKVQNAASGGVAKHGEGR